MAKKEDKSNKHEARRLWERAREAFALGDYERTRELDQQVVRASPDSDVGRLAAQELESFGLESRIRLAGIGAVVLYGLAWVVALWG